MPKEILSFPGMLVPDGSYSQATKANGFIFISEQLGIDPETGRYVGEHITQQAHQALKNLGAILRSQGLGYGDVVKTTLIFDRLADFDEFNRVYVQYFTEDYPTRLVFHGPALPPEARIGIYAIAACGKEAD